MFTLLCEMLMSGNVQTGGRKMEKATKEKRKDV